MEILKNQSGYFKTFWEKIIYGTRRIKHVMANATMLGNWICGYNLLWNSGHCQSQNLIRAFYSREKWSDSSVNVGFSQHVWIHLTILLKQRASINHWVSHLSPERDIFKVYIWLTPTLLWFINSSPITFIVFLSFKGF